MDALIGDYDPSTQNTLFIGAAVDVGSGAALMALSEPVHVVIGAILIATGVFLFGWALRHRVSHAKLREALAEPSRSGKVD